VAFSARYLTYRTLAAALSRLPESVAVGVAVGVSRAMALRQSESLAMGERNLRRVLASECVHGVEPDTALVRRLARRSFGQYARYWVDGSRLPSLSPEKVRAHFRLERAENDTNLREAWAQGRGIVMALPHVGSWEWGGAWLALEGMPMTAVMERLEPPELFEWFVGQRAGMGLTAVPMGEGSSTALLKALRDHVLVGLVSDRDLVGNGVPVTFFGERTTLPGGAATLALRTGAPLVPVVVYSGPGSWHTAEVLPALDTTRSGSLRDDVQRLTQELATIFEDLIRRRPEQWHMYQPNWPSDVAGGDESS